MSRGPTGPRDFDFQEIPWDAIKRWAPVVIVVVVLLLVGKELAYTVEAHEQAVVLRFGKYLTTNGSGLHFKLPYIDKAIKVNVAEQPVEFGFKTDAPGKFTRFAGRTERHKAESLILTGDLNCADVQWAVQFQVVDPVDYLFQVEEVEDTIRGVSLMAMRGLVGDMSLHEVITTGRDELQRQAREQVQKRLDELRCGVNITQMQIIHAKPPEKVKAAFEDVNIARQEYDQAINEAEREERRIIPEAEAKRTELEQSADGYYAEVTMKAQGERDALLARFEAYSKAPEATRQRLYIEAMESVLKGAKRKMILDGRLKGLLPLLPLNQQGGAK